MKNATLKQRAIGQGAALLATISLLAAATTAHAQVYPDEPQPQLIKSLPRLSSLMPYSVNGQPHFLAYSTDTGDAQFCRINSDGSNWTVLAQYGWTKGWTFMPYQVNGQPYFLAYNTVSGQADFIRITPNGGGYELKARYGWDKRETFVPYQVNGVPHFLSYNPVSGLARFNRIESDGGRYTLLTTQAWGKHSDRTPISGVQYWTNFASFTANGNPYLLLYAFNNLGAGEFPRYRTGLAISQILPSGGLVASVSNTVWDGQDAEDHYWSQFMPFELNGRPYLFASVASTGTAWMTPMPGL